MVRLMISFLLLSMSMNSAWAEQLTFEFVDPIGDATGGAPDVISASVEFDTQTGAFTATVTASRDQPFFPLAPDFLTVNINAHNPDAGPNADPAYFKLHLPVSDWDDTSEHFVRSGVNTRLMAWEAGDRVALSSSVFGGAIGASVFYSSISTCGPFGRECYGFDTISPSESTFVTAVPEPLCPFLPLIFLIFHTYRRR